MSNKHLKSLKNTQFLCTQRESMKVLVKASSIATVARDLVTKHGLLPWLVSFIKDTL